VILRKRESRERHVQADSKKMSKRRASTYMEKPTSTKKFKKQHKKTYNSGRMVSVNPKAELKAFDTTIALASTSAGTQIAVNLPVVGADFFNRVGRKIYMKSLHLRGQWIQTQPVYKIK